MIVSPTEEALIDAATLLRRGELVAFPTETVYGLGADALNDKAVKKIFAVKGRPSSNPLIVHLLSLAWINRVAVPSDYCMKQLERLSQFWPGPLSVVVPKCSTIPLSVTAGQESVAIRIPNHTTALRLLELVNTPLAAPSANPSLYVSPTTAKHVEDQLGEQVKMILDGGPCQVGLESTVLSLVHPVPTILRPGAVTREQLEERLKQEVATNTVNATNLSPGTQDIHYAPHTRVFLNQPPDSMSRRLGLIAFTEVDRITVQKQYTEVRVLSKNGEFPEIASRLFSALRELDALGLDGIVVDVCEEHGLGAAIMDRLRRASAR